jgi:hypothetical protein
VEISKVEVGGGDVFILAGQSSTDKGDRGRGFAGFTLSYAICLALRGPWTSPISNIFTGSTVVGPSLAINMQYTMQIATVKYCTTNVLSPPLGDVMTILSVDQAPVRLSPTNDKTNEMGES